MLKVIALATSIMIWQYVGIERSPSAMRIISVEVQLEGAPPENLVVNIPHDKVAVEVSGPKADVEALQESSIRAVVNASVARPNSQQLEIVSFVRPTSASRLLFVARRKSVSVEVTEKKSKKLPIVPSYTVAAPLGKSFSTPRLDPPDAEVIGEASELARVAKLVVYVRTDAGNVRSDLPIQALDKDGVLIDKVVVKPKQVRVSIDITEAPAERTLVVSSRLRGLPDAPFTVSQVLVEPDQVTVTGRPEDLLGLTRIETQEVSVDGAKLDVIQSVRMLLPPGVSVKTGTASARVVVKLQDSSTTNP